MAADTLADWLEQALTKTGVEGAYADLARRSLSILREAEQKAHDAVSPGASLPYQVSVTIIAQGRTEGGNDGWLERSADLKLHRRGIAHVHPGGPHFHEVQDILIYAIGAAWSLQWLGVNLDRIICFVPVYVGRGVTRWTSHGKLPIPAPATRAILEQYQIPFAPGPVDCELLTPTGAAILAALSPTFVSREEKLPEHMRLGVGLGAGILDSASALRLFVTVT